MEKTSTFRTEFGFPGTVQKSDAEIKRRQEALKSWEEADITNDFIFYKVMEGNYDLCLKLVQIILPDLNVRELRYVNEQETVKGSYDSKGIRMDIFVKDEFERAIDIEMQVVAAKNLPKRSRYYQSVVDITTLKEGEPYSKLKDSYIIFICPEDPFGPDGKIYTFGDTCYEYPELRLNSGAIKIFLNASGTAGEVNNELDQFLKYVKGEKVADNGTAADFLIKLQRAVELAKQNSEWRREFMVATMRDLEKIEEGREEGREEMVLSFIMNKKKKGVSTSIILDEVIEDFGLSGEQASRLVNGQAK